MIIYSTTPAAMKLRIKLKTTETPVTRIILVPLTIRYDQLHVLIQLAFEWSNSHLYGFTTGDKTSYQGFVDDFDGFYGPKPKLASENYVYPDFNQGKITYTYDFGRDWQHEITLMEQVSVNGIRNQQLPRITFGRGSNRVEDSFEDEAGSKFSKDHVNALFDLWSRAGEQMIRADDMGLDPKYDD